MRYLKNYGLSDDDIKEVYNSLDDYDWSEVTFHRFRVMDLLDYFKSVGITNFKDMLLYKPDIFYLSASEMEKIINKCDVKNIIEKLNEDVINFELIGF